MTIGLMIAHVPSWWGAALLALAAYRTWHLAALDTIIEPLRRRAYRLDGDGEPADGYRRSVDDFVGCPWCFGYWVAVAWWAAWLVWPHGALLVATPFALSAVVGLLAKLD
jgi:Protein of unknown function (DUF1360)